MRFKWFTFLLLCLALTVSATACSQKQIYQNIQENQKQECKKLPMSDQADCFSQYEQSFGEYEDQRKRADQ